jgi:hypothetical protein
MEQIHPDFKRLFFEKEGKELMGVGRRNLWILASIMLVTFTAIGFANGSLAYLEKKMSNPFISWVSIEVPWAKSEEKKLQEIFRDVESDELKAQYGYDQFSSSKGFSCLMQTGSSQEFQRIRGRTLRPDDPLLGEILSENNFVSGFSEGFRDEKDLGLIVTKRAMKKLGYSEETILAGEIPYLLMQYSMPLEDSIAKKLGIQSDVDEERAIPIPINAVVEELPDLRDFVSTQYFQYNKDASDNAAFSPEHSKNVLWYYFSNEDLAFEFWEKMQEFTNAEADQLFANLNPYVTRPGEDEFFLSENSQGYRTGITFENIRHWKEVDLLHDEIAQQEWFQQHKPVRVYTYLTSPIPNTGPKAADYFSVNFLQLDKIRTFRDYFLEKHDIDIDIAQVESKENYNYVSRLTQIISLILIGLSVLSICLFVSNIFRQHLQKVSRNLGTFKAFGIDNSTLLSTYLRMIGLLLLASIVISLVGSAIIGYAGGVRLLLSALGLSVEDGESYYKLFDFWTYFAIVAVAIIAILVLYRTGNKILSKTPGDLIYSR